jgi:hypothetical protein
MTELKLTHKQEAFAQAYVETGIAAEAYRRAYSTGGMKETTIWRNAHEVLKNNKVSARVQHLTKIAQKVQEEKFSITIETITSMLLADRDLARDVNQTSAAVSATKALAGLHGLVIDRKEVGRPGEFSEMSDDELATIARRSSGISGEGASKASPHSTKLH